MKNTKFLSSKIFIIAAVIAIIGLAVLFLWNNTTKKEIGNSANKGSGVSSESNNNYSSSSSGQKNVQKVSSAQNEACKKLTLAEAKSIIGNNATVEESSVVATGAKSVTVYVCGYTTGAKVLKLDYQVAANSDGKTANENTFKAAESSKAVAVNHFGQEAYWLSDTGAMYVMQDSNLYIIRQSAGAGASPVSQQNMSQIAKQIL